MRRFLKSLQEGKERMRENDQRDEARDACGGGKRRGVRGEGSTERREAWRKKRTDWEAEKTGDEVPEGT